MEEGLLHTVKQGCSWIKGVMLATSVGTALQRKSSVHSTQGVENCAGRFLHILPIFTREPEEGFAISLQDLPKEEGFLVPHGLEALEFLAWPPECFPISPRVWGFWGFLTQPRPCQHAYLPRISPAQGFLCFLHKTCGINSGNFGLIKTHNTDSSLISCTRALLF